MFTYDEAFGVRQLAAALRKASLLAEKTRYCREQARGNKAGASARTPNRHPKYVNESMTLYTRLYRPELACRTKPRNLTGKRLATAG